MTCGHHHKEFHKSFCFSTFKKNIKSQPTSAVFCQFKKKKKRKVVFKKALYLDCNIIGSDGYSSGVSGMSVV